ncbi:MAG: hypothetical protein HYT20_02770 [Candidatus Nealsonbacteria bacterium]|nr:hypothetical protein [Candidatus Nealsonbacteria bacterium]
MKINELKNKKILILGFGREGQDSFLFLKKLFPRKILGIADQKEFSISNFKFSNTKRHFGRDYLGALKDYDIVIKSPGIPFKVLRRTGLRKITTQTDIFFENCPGTIIGVTGTKGKSTTSYWIYQVLKNGGLKAHLVGNIGKPVLMSLLKAKKNDIFVYELSAHQLYNLKQSPHIAVLLNIYPEHLDYYKSFKEYASAKANIAKYQTKNDYLIYNCKDPLVVKIAQKSRAKKIPIQGKYYELDRAAAEAVAKIFRLPMPKKLKFLPHRLEYVGKFKGIKFYNDSLSTVTEPAIEALDFFGESVQTMILGGYDRGMSFKKLAKRLSESKIKTFILFPTTGKRIWQELRKLNRVKFELNSVKFYFVNSMEKAVKLAYNHTDKGKICLMSPASPSFGIFKDYAERGDAFKKFVKKHGAG